MRTVLPCTQSHCRGCTLEVVKGRKLGTDVVHSQVRDGFPKVDVLIVNNFPSQQDDSTGNILGSKGGLELRSALQDAGIYEVAYTNLVRCRPVDKTGLAGRPASLEEQQSCANHVWEDIERLQPKLVVTMGEMATRALVPYEKWHKKAVQETGGETHEHRGVTFMPIPSPYDWAFDLNAYPHRKRLRRLCQLMKMVLSPPTPFSLLGHSWYCGTIAEVKMAVNKIRQLRRGNKRWVGVGLDTEGQGLARVATNGVSCIQISPSTDIGYVIPLDHHDSPWTPEQRVVVIGLLRDLFLDDSLEFDTWIAHEGKFDLNQILRVLQIKRFAKPIVDPIFLEFIDDENMRAKEDEEGGGADSFRSSFSLKTLTAHRLNFRHYDQDILEVRVKHEGFWRLPMRAEIYTGRDAEIATKYTDYSGMDGYAALRLCIVQEAEMYNRGYTKAFNLAKLWGSRCMHLRRSMEKNGIKIDESMLSFLHGPNSPVTVRLNEIPEELWDTPEVIEANKRILGSDTRTAGMTPLFGQTPKVFDLNKKEHKVALLVDVCGLAPVEKPSQKKKTEEKQLPAIDAKFYAQHEHHPIVILMKEHTGLSKLKSSYVNPMIDYLNDPKYVDNQHDNRLHPYFHDTRTLTGRLASSDPSVHQTARGDTFAKKCVKSLIGCEDGNCIIEGDYAQAEVRWWAQMAGDRDMADMFWKMYEIQQAYYKNPTPELFKRKELECDIHRQVAALMYGLDIDKVTKDKRQAAKNIVFGAIYGQSAQALAQILKISAKEAAELQAKFITRFKQAGPWLTEIEELAKRQGYVDAPNGRRRHLQYLFQIDEGGARRKARNSPIQAIASDVMAEAAYMQQCWIEDRGYDDDNSVRIINLIHDALLQEVRLDLDLIREVIGATTKHMMYDVGPMLERDYGCKLIVPLVADFKLGLRWGHAKEWDQGDDITKIFNTMQAQTERIRTGGKFWHIAVEQQIVSAKKDLEGQQADLLKLTDATQIRVAKRKVDRMVKHVNYLSSISLT